MWRRPTAALIDTTSNAVVDTVLVGDAPVAVAVKPDGAFAYVTSNGADTASVIDTDPTSSTYNTVVATVGVGDGARPLGLAVTPDGAFVYVANTLTNYVSVIRTADNTLVATVTTAGGGQWVAITPF